MESEGKLLAVGEWELSGPRADAFGICTVDGDGMLWGHDWSFDRYSDCLARTCRRCGAFCYDYKKVPIP